MIEFSIPGKPTAKARARSSWKGGKVQHYTPGKTAAYESTVALFGSQAMGGKPPLDGPLMVHITAHMPIPASWSKKKQAMASDGDLLPTSRPDLDNIIKAVKDGLNEICWHDDSQIVSVIAHKIYGDKPMVEVSVSFAD